MFYLAVATAVETMSMSNEGIADFTGGRPVAAYSRAPPVKSQEQIGAML